MNIIRSLALQGILRFASYVSLYDQYF